MTKFERLKGFFKFLKVENCPYKHWSNSTSWTMVESMHNVVLQATTFFIGGKLYVLHVTNQTIGVVSLVSKEVWVAIVTSLKERCSSAIVGLIIELEK
jgi:hypothetical protein